jgi:phage FluMu protein Com
MEENHMITHFDEYNLSCPKCGTLSKIVDAGSKDNVVTFIIECEKCNKLFLALGEKESEEWKFAEVERKK